MTSAPVQLVLDRLASLGTIVRGVPDGYMAQCPAHDDRTPSLHLSAGADGRALLCCLAGCDFADVCRSLDITPGATFADDRERRTAAPALRDVRSVVRLEPVCEYVYTDEQGTPVVKVARLVQVDARGTTVGKTFRQYRMTEAGTWTAGLAGVVPPLYRLPEILAAVREGRTVLVVEGEKDADRAVALGYVATTCAMGAGKWRPEHTAALTGATVLVVADDDPPGRRHACEVAAALAGVACSVVMFLPAEGYKDLSDHLDADLELSALRPMPPEQTEPAEVPPAPGARFATLLVTTEQLDDIPEPTYLVRGVLQVDSLAWLQGRPGHGKSFVALDIAGSVATGLPWQTFPVLPGVVLYVVAEGLHGIQPRVRAWEQAARRPMTGVHFLPLAVNASTAAWGELCAVAELLGAALVVLDTQARMTVGLEENSARDMGLYVEALETLRAATGAAVLSVHHEGRSGDTMRGSTAMDGAATTILRVAKEDELIKVQCVKQKEAAPMDDLTLRLVAHGSSVVPVITDAATVRRSSGLGNRPWVRSWWSNFRTEWVSVTDLVDTGTTKKATFHEGKYALINAGLVEARGEGNSRRYRLTRPPVAGAESGGSGGSPAGLTGPQVAVSPVESATPT